MFKTLDKQMILSDFPNIKLSYENITHKKVYNSDMILVIPDGKKCFAWFTYINDKPSCLVMELAGDKNINDIKHVNACFSNELSYGTILYGTLFTHLGNRFFTIEDIFSYRDELIERKDWIYKMEKIKKMLKYDLKQVSYNNSFVIFGLPIICRTNDELENKLQNVKYKINSIQYRLYNRINSYLFITYDNYINQKEIIVVNKYVKPEVQLQEKSFEKIVVKQPAKSKASKGSSESDFTCHMSHGTGKPFGENIEVVKNYIHKISTEYNIDKKNIINDFLNYIIRNKSKYVSKDFLNFVENLMHSQIQNNNTHIYYSLSRLSSFISA